MSTTDEVIGSIDHALRDFATGPDAMRWSPDPPKVRDRASIFTLALQADVTRFTAAMAEATVRWEAAFRPVLKAVAKAMAEMGNALWVPPDSERAERLANMHAAYRSRARRRTRRNR
jgi:hypothetical protein